MTMQDVRSMTDDQLQDNLLKLKKKNSLTCASSRPRASWKNTARFSKVRKDIARLKTDMRRRQIEKQGS